MGNSHNKPNSDYHRLDLVIRKVESGKITKEIEKDYKSYLGVMARVDDVSITKYIHNLIEKDMKKRNKEYELAKNFMK